MTTLPYAVWQVSEDKELKLRLTSLQATKVEEKIGVNLLKVFMPAEGESFALPPLKVMLLLTHGALQKYEHGISFEDVSDLYDSYVDNGGDQAAFMAGGSINSPEKSSYHLEITATSEEHALFMASLLERFNIHAKITTRRKKVILYVKSAEKIADFLRLIEADQAVLKFENIRISRDFSNSLQRMNNMDLANEVKAVAAASGQLDDIRILEENQKIETLDHKLQDIIALRKANPEASLMELCGIYERQTGEIVSKSGMKHRFVKLHELAMKEVKQDE